jgi:hypothetical protein
MVSEFFVVVVEHDDELVSSTANRTPQRPLTPTATPTTRLQRPPPTVTHPHLVAVLGRVAPPGAQMVRTVASARRTGIGEIVTAAKGTGAPLLGVARHPLQDALRRPQLCVFAVTHLCLRFFTIIFFRPLAHPRFLVSSVLVSGLASATSTTSLADSGASRR